MKLRNKGFTLIELIIVVAILAVLTAIVAPNFARYIERSRNAVDMHDARVIADAITTYYAANPDELAKLTAECDKKGGAHCVQVSVAGTSSAISDVLRPALYEAGLIDSLTGTRFKITCKSKAKWIGYRVAASDYSRTQGKPGPLKIYYWGVPVGGIVHHATDLGTYQTDTDPTGFKEAMNGG